MDRREPYWSPRLGEATATESATATDAESATATDTEIGHGNGRRIGYGNGHRIGNPRRTPNQHGDGHRIGHPRPNGRQSTPSEVTHVRAHMGATQALVPRDAATTHGPDSAFPPIARSPSRSISRRLGRGRRCPSRSPIDPRWRGPVSDGTAFAVTIIDDMARMRSKVRTGRAPSGL